MEKVTGVSSVRLLPPYARQRFTTWFKRRRRVRIAKRQGRVAVFPTCLVEYQNPAIGQDLVKVYERNGIECSLADGAGCCGAPWLHSGDVEQFTKVAAQEREGACRRRCARGNDIVVPQPTCGYVLKKDYLDYVGGRRRPARRRAHLRRGRVPDEGAQGRGHDARHRLRRATSRQRSRTTRPATSGPRTSG